MTGPLLLVGVFSKLSVKQDGFSTAVLPTLFLVALLIVVMLSGCATEPPADPGDICSVFEQKRGWYKDVQHAEKRWGAPAPILMAIIYQESRFEADARPPRKKILWVIPGPHASNAYGYPQALDSTWSDYQRATGNRGADRNDFGDAVDFVGWYNHQSWSRNQIPKTDAYNLYLAYHEGQGGYARGTYRRKEWLQSAAKRVAQRAQMYADQLMRCR
ncbi:MAG: transglycosylase SLT domain-containing protein [Pseudomonadota bacterium]|nr:transglycosylase SLT domain-containing protein [Pseudomonadota bacterium]